MHKRITDSVFDEAEVSEACDQVLFQTAQTHITGIRRASWEAAGRAESRPAETTVAAFGVAKGTHTAATVQKAALTDWTWEEVARLMNRRVTGCVVCEAKVRSAGVHTAKAASRAGGVAWLSVGCYYVTGERCGLVARSSFRLRVRGQDLRRGN
jgi:hypothetical protein